MVVKTVALAVYTFCFLAGLPSNLLACSAFLRKMSQKPTTMDILLLNLTVSDLLCLLFLPFKMMEVALDMTWPLPAFLCPLTNFCFYSSIYLSTLFLMGISVERYLCVAFPVKYKLHRKPLYAILASVFFWLLTCSHCATVIYVVEYHNTTSVKVDNFSTCFETFSLSQLHILLPLRLEICLVLFCLPFIITCFCYVNVVWILTSMPNIPSHRKQRAVGLAVVTLLNFVIAFAPYNISHIVGFFEKQSPSWRVETFFLTSLNTTLDPIIFFFSTTTIQRTFVTCHPSLGCRFPVIVSPRCLHCYETSKAKDEVGNLSASNLPNSLATGGNSIVCKKSSED